MEELFLRLYPLVPEEHQFYIEPSIRSRDWMIENPHSFKCFPITNANSFGWDILTPSDIEIEWNGGKKTADLIVTEGQHLAKTNFGFGIVTFHIGFTWHTSSGWSVMFSPVPNYNHESFSPITAIVESDKLKYPIFISAKLTKPGKTLIPKRTPICRVIPIKTVPAIECQPEIQQEPQDFLEYRNWQARERTSFLADKEKRKECKGWQKFYYEIAENPTVKMKEVKPLPEFTITLRDNENA